MRRGPLSSSTPTPLLAQGVSHRLALGCRSGGRATSRDGSKEKSCESANICSAYPMGTMPGSLILFLLLPPYSGEERGSVMTHGQSKRSEPVTEVTKPTLPVGPLTAFADGLFPVEWSTGISRICQHNEAGVSSDESPGLGDGAHSLFLPPSRWAGLLASLGVWAITLDIAQCYLSTRNRTSSSTSPSPFWCQES